MGFLRKPFSLGKKRSFRTFLKETLIHIVYCCIEVAISVWRRRFTG